MATCHSVELSLATMHHQQWRHFGLFLRGARDKRTQNFRGGQRPKLLHKTKISGGAQAPLAPPEVTPLHMTRVGNYPQNLLSADSDIRTLFFADIGY